MRKRAFGIAAVVAGLTVGMSGPAVAAQDEFVMTCGQESVTLRANQSNSSENGGWSVAQVRSEGGGHFIPVTFAGIFANFTQDFVIDEFSVSKGRGNGNRNQPTITCTDNFTGTWEDFAEEGDELPPGTELTDILTWTFTVTAVRK